MSRAFPASKSSRRGAVLRAKGSLAGEPVQRELFDYKLRLPRNG